MLKIKDNVDLKKLEKFGLKPKYDEDTGNIIAYIRHTNEHKGIGAYKHKKEISFRIFKAPTKKVEWRINSYYNFFDVDLLYDLIQAGIVEKI